MYRNMNDYEILYMVSENTGDIFNILYQKYQPLIYQIARKNLNLFKKFGYEVEDLMQIGYITLYKCSYLYNIYSDSMFFSYFKSSLKNALINEMRKNKTLRRETLNNAFSYDTKIPNTDLSFKEVFGDNKKNNIELYNKVFFELKNTMPFSLACVFELYINGYNLSEISILLCLKENDLNKMLKEIKKTMLTYKCLFFEKDMLQCNV